MTWAVGTLHPDLPMISDLMYRARRFAAHRLGVDTAEKVAAGGGERQAAPHSRHFRADHRGRYLFARNHLRDGARVLDLACGVGYGSAIVAEDPRCGHVVGVDVSEDAIAYGREHFEQEKVSLRLGDALTIDGLGDPFDLVTSFETLEHLDAPALLPRLHGWLRDDGRLLASVPNQATLPFSTERFPFHLRHYTQGEFRELLTEGGFAVEELLSQHDPESEELRADADGLFLVAVCKKS